MSCAEIQNSNPQWYNALCGHLTEDQQKELQEVVVLADQRTAARGKWLIYTQYTSKGVQIITLRNTIAIEDEQIELQEVNWFGWSN